MFEYHDDVNEKRAELEEEIKRLRKQLAIARTEFNKVIDNSLECTECSASLIAFEALKEIDALEPKK